MSSLCCVVPFETCASLEQPVASMLFLGATGVGKTQERFEDEILGQRKSKRSVPERQHHARQRQAHGVKQVQPSNHDRHDWGNQQQDFDAINAQGHGCGEHSRCCRDAGTHPVEFAVDPCEGFVER